MDASVFPDLPSGTLRIRNGLACLPRRIKRRARKHQRTHDNDRGEGRGSHPRRRSRIPLLNLIPIAVLCYESKLPRRLATKHLHHSGFSSLPFVFAPLEDYAGKFVIMPVDSILEVFLQREINKVWRGMVTDD